MYNHKDLPLLLLFVAVVDFRYGILIHFPSSQPCRQKASGSGKLVRRFLVPLCVNK